MANDLDELRREYDERGIGPAIFDEVRRAVGAVVHRYDPMVYAGASTWEDAMEDVVQGVIVDVLIQEGQLDYIMATAGTIEDVRNLLRFQVKRYLAKGRRRTVVDNLLDRCKERLRASPFRVIDGGPPERYGLEDGGVDPRAPTDEELHAAARAAALVPRTRPSAGDRAPAVYTREALDALLEAVARSLPSGFSLSELGTILEMVLTDWVAGFLYDFEGGEGPEEVALGPEEEAMSAAAIEQILEQCSEEQLLILRRKLEDVADEAIARELGVSRPTVHARKQEVLGTMRDVLRDVPERVQKEVMDRLSMHLVRLGTTGGGADG